MRLGSVPDGASFESDVLLRCDFWFVVLGFQERRTTPRRLRAHCFVCFDYLIATGRYHARLLRWRLQHHGCALDGHPGTVTPAAGATMAAVRALAALALLVALHSVAATPSSSAADDFTKVRPRWKRATWRRARARGGSTTANARGHLRLQSIHGDDTPQTFEPHQVYAAFSGGGNRAMLGTVTALGAIKEAVRSVHTRH
jgi:hypothetical protein